MIDNLNTHNQHPLFDVFICAIGQAMHGKGVRHGGAATPFLEQPWTHYAKLHGRGFLTGQASKKLDEAASTRHGEPFIEELRGALVYIGMAILDEQARLEAEKRAFAEQERGYLGATDQYARNAAASGLVGAFAGPGNEMAAQAGLAAPACNCMDDYGNVPHAAWCESKKTVSPDRDLAALNTSGRDVRPERNGNQGAWWGRSEVVEETNADDVKRAHCGTCKWREQPYDYPPCVTCKNNIGAPANTANNWEARSIDSR